MEASSIKKLFKTAESFVIPAYQRAYSWGRKQREQFVQDLMDANGNYYLGHFLFEKDENNDTMFIIDGQQRLTTVVIFFSCLKHALEKRDDLNDPKICRYIANQYLRNEIVGNVYFKTVSYDNPFFENYIIDRKYQSTDEDCLNSSSKRHIKECRNYFDSVFENKEIKTETLLQWMRLIEEAKVTEYHVTSKIEAAQIFAFQNDRGKSLTQLEVLKSFFMLQIYLRAKNSIQINDSIEKLNYYFQHIYESIVNTSIKEDDILRYYWIAFYDTKGYYTENVVAEAEDYFKNRPIEDILNVVEMLSRTFVYVVGIERDNKNFDIQNLKRIDRKAQHYPLMIRCKIICGVSGETYNRLLRLLENVLFRAAVRGGRADIESRLNGLRGAMKDEESTKRAIDDFINRIKNDYWNDWELRESLNSGSMYFHKKMCRYVLWRYEQSLCPANYPATRISWDNIMSNESLEHIAPQTNPEQITAGYGKYRDFEHPEEGIETGGWLHCLGNMLLLTQSQNSAAGNHPLKYKLDVYDRDDSLIRQQHEIRGYCKHIAEGDEYLWDVECIKKRLEHIVKQSLTEIWNLDKI